MKNYKISEIIVPSVTDLPPLTSEAASEEHEERKLELKRQRRRIETNLKQALRVFY